MNYFLFMDYYFLIFWFMDFMGFWFMNFMFLLWTLFFVLWTVIIFSNYGPFFVKVGVIWLLFFSRISKKGRFFKLFILNSVSIFQSMWWFCQKSEFMKDFVKITNTKKDRDRITPTLSRPYFLVMTEIWNLIFWNWDFF